MIRKDDIPLGAWVRKFAWKTTWLNQHKILWKSYWLAFVYDGDRWGEFYSLTKPDTQTHEEEEI